MAMKTNGIVSITFLFIATFLSDPSYTTINCIWAHVFPCGIGKQTDTSYGHPAPPQPSKHWILWFFFCTLTLWFPFLKKKITALSNLTILWVISYIARTLFRWPDENELISSCVSPQQGYRIPRIIISPSLVCRIWNFSRLCLSLLPFPIAFISFQGLHSHAWISLHCHVHLSSTQQLSRL